MARTSLSSARDVTADPPCDHILTAWAALNDSGVSIVGRGVGFYCEWDRKKHGYAAVQTWVDANGIPERVQRPTFDA
jgi:hypothetical protein